MHEIKGNHFPPVWQPLVNTARNARRYAKVRYSGYQVGAAVLDENGKVSGGCNVENGAYTGTHAERSAISTMIYPTLGNQVRAVAVATRDGGTPCGDCRQHIWEYCKGDTSVPVFLVDDNGKVMATTIGELLSHPFNL